MIAMLWGAGFGLGLTALIYGIRPPAVGLAEAERILASETSADMPAPAASGEPGLGHRLTAPAIRALSAFGLPGDRLTTDLALTGQDTETFLTKKITAAVAGLLMPALFQLIRTAVGVGLSSPVSHPTRSRARRIASDPSASTTDSARARLAT